MDLGLCLKVGGGGGGGGGGSSKILEHLSKKINCELWVDI
jgi:hypothetical protein